MLLHLKSKDIDKQKWDTCILQSINSLPYALSWYLDIVHPNWEAIIYKDYEIVMPLPVKYKMGIPYLTIPKYIQQLGLFYSSIPEQSIVDTFLTYLEKAWYIKKPYHFNYHNRIFLPNYALRTNLVLTMKEEYAVLKTKMQYRARYTIRKALSANTVEIIVTDDYQAIISIFQQSKHGEDIQYWNKESYNLLLELLNTYNKYFVVESYTAYNKDKEPISGIILLHYYDRIILIFTGTNIEGREQKAMPLLIHHVLQKYASSNKIIDFEGSNDANLALFWKQFGVVEQNYPVQ